MKVIFDIEADGLLDTITKIHCLSYMEVGSDKVTSLTTYREIQDFLSRGDITLVGHNVVRYDLPAIRKILGVEVKCKVIDTLPLSWVFFPDNDSHGLEAWGTRLGVQKPEISDWSNLTIEQYVFRCTEDVKINMLLWNKVYDYLSHLYDNDEEIDRYCAYLSYKMDCVREQEEIGIKLDVNRCEKVLGELRKLKGDKYNALIKAMPKVEIKKKRVYKNAVVGSNGDIVESSDLFFPSDFVGKDIVKETVVGHQEPNPNSTTQIKAWLFSLGWKPKHIKYVRDKGTNKFKEIPQISSKWDVGEVCESIKELYEKEPAFELLNGMSVLSHRIAIFEGFLRDQVGGRLYASCSGLTNTLRLQHKVIVNLPGFDKLYGPDVRGCLIADDGARLCGSDLSGIEDNTKRHYIYKYDPKYVEDMKVKGYDAHLEIAVLAGFLTKGQADEHKLYETSKGTSGKSHKATRQKAKTVNFSATYKVSAPTLARNAGITKMEAKKLLDVYWNRNNAILKVEDSLSVKEVYGSKWVLNPVSGFWYSLRAEKDRFSTLNQGTAVYVFDVWLGYIRHGGIKVAYQCHDEWLANVENDAETIAQVQIATAKVNKKLNLNVEIECSAAFGHDYSEAH